MALMRNPQQVNHQMKTDWHKINEVITRHETGKQLLRLCDRNGWASRYDVIAGILPFFRKIVCQLKIYIFSSRPITLLPTFAVLRYVQPKMSKITYTWITIDIFQNILFYLLYSQRSVNFIWQTCSLYPGKAKNTLIFQNECQTLWGTSFSKVFFVEVIDAKRNIIKQITVILSFHRVNISRPILGKQVHSRGTYLYGFTI